MRRENLVLGVACGVVLLIGGVGAGTSSVAQDGAERNSPLLEKAREAYESRRARYREVVQECTQRARAVVEKSGSPDLARVFEEELRAFQDGGPPPALVRTKAYERYWGANQRDLVAAQSALERALIEARRLSFREVGLDRTERLEAELKKLRACWILAGQPAQTVELLASAEGPHPPVWRYTIEDPGLDWFKPEYEGPNWLQGRAGFGGPGMRNLNVRTTWITERIWMRRSVVVPRRSPEDVFVLRLRYDEDAEIFVNGRLLLKAPGYNDSYATILLNADQKRLLHEGKNVLGVFCRNARGGQGIDMGLTVYRGASDVVAATARGPREPDRFEMGSVWEGSRTHLDPVTPDETLSCRMEIMQRMGSHFLARLTLTGPRGTGDHIVFGRLEGGRLVVTEPTGGTHQLVSTGTLANDAWTYEFRGRGGGGAERYGRGEMKPKGRSEIERP